MFDGHGGPEVAACIRQNVIKLFFEDVNFLGTSEVDKVFLEEVKDSLIKAFLLADSTLADEITNHISLYVHLTCIFTTQCEQNYQNECKG